MSSLSSMVGVGGRVLNQYVSEMSRNLSAIQQASAGSGVDFSYLVNNAKQESGLDSAAKSASSTAKGLFQFVEQTWLRMVKAYGEKYGLTDAASRISIDGNGVAKVNDTQTKKEILALRNDPTVSSQMAAELTNENKAALQKSVGGKIGDTELYLAHFLGSGGAGVFLNKLRSDPQACAANYLPTAASANSAVFYDKAGNPKTFKEIYQCFAQKFQNNDAYSTKTMVADAGNSAAFSLYTPSVPSISPFSTSGRSADLSAQNYYSSLILAQMDFGNIDDALSTDASAAYDTQTKRSALSTLASA